MNIKKELKYIMKLAKKGDSRKVQLGELVLFSTQTGDAWILDTEDHLAICLMKNKIKQQFTLIDTPTQFGFDWEYNYYIEDDCFITIDRQGNHQRYDGYPVQVLK